MLCIIKARLIPATSISTHTHSVTNWDIKVSPPANLFTADKVGDYHHFCKEKNWLFCPTQIPPYLMKTNSYCSKSILISASVRTSEFYQEQPVCGQTKILKWEGTQGQFLALLADFKIYISEPLISCLFSFVQRDNSFNSLLIFRRAAANKQESRHPPFGLEPS